MTETKKTLIAVAVGSKIRSIRQTKKWTIEQLAFEVGIEYTQLSRIERGKINTSIFQIFLISNALQVSIGEIISTLDQLPADIG